MRADVPARTRVRAARRLKTFPCVFSLPPNTAPVYCRGADHTMGVWVAQTDRGGGGRVGRDGGFAAKAPLGTRGAEIVARATARAIARFDGILRL